MTRIGVGGLMNLDKLKQAHIILNDIHLFHHSAQQQRALMQKLEDMDQEEFRSEFITLLVVTVSVDWLIYMFVCLFV